MKFLPIYQVSLHSVSNAGVPNQECIVLRPQERVNLAEYFICLGHISQDGTVVPVRDYFFFFGDRWVEPPSWVMLFTGPGEVIETVIRETKQKAYIFHWSKKHTIFHSPEFVPVLFHVDS